MLRRLLALASVCCACGAVDPPRPAPAVAHDGLAPWDEPEALSLCVGGRAVVPPSNPTAPLGFCVRTAPLACTTDSVCAAGSRCICGRCALALCRSDDDCAGGRACDPESHRCASACVADSACGDGSVCRAGYCARTCARRDDCGSSELCDDLGRCVAAPCRTDDECGGDRCDATLREALLREPSVVVEGDRAVLYVSATGEGILRAVSEDGVRFRADPEAPVLDATHAAPSVVRVGTSLWMALLRDGTIALSRSDDGVRWRDARPLVATDDAGAGTVGSPALAADARGVTLAYATDGAIAVTTLRSDGDEVTAGMTTRVAPDLFEDARLWRGVSSLDAPMLLWVREPSGRSALRLYLSAVGEEVGAAVSARGETAAVAHRSIGVAVRTEGGFAASRANPVLALGFGPDRAHDAHEPTVYVVGGRYRMMLRRTTRDGRDEGLWITPMR